MDINFGTNRKGICDIPLVLIVTLVLSRTVSEILQVFVLMTHPEVRSSVYVKLIGHKVIFEVFQPM